NVTELMQRGVGAFMLGLIEAPGTKENVALYLGRLNAVAGIREIDFHIEQVAGEDKTIEVVVDIFNKVNSGGTKLSKGDLALARICASWPEARERMRDRLKHWADAGFYFDLDWLLRNVTTIATGQALFSGLSGVTVAEFQDG